MFDVDNPPIEAFGVALRTLLLAAWKASRPRSADANERDFNRWWKHEESELAAGRSRGTLRAQCQAAYNAAWPHAPEYEPGDGFGAWWQSITDEARLSADGVPSPA